MSAVPQGQSSDRGRRLAVGTWRLDAGLRLLVAGPGLEALRWSTDPDAPATHQLDEGEIRLSVRWVELSAADLHRSRLDEPRGSRTAPDDWRQLTGTGVGEVIESQAGDCPVGGIVRGPLHVGTHAVLRVVSVDGHGLQARASASSAPAARRYAWSAGPLNTVAAAGMSAVEQAVRSLRDQGHVISMTVAVTLADGDSSNAVVHR